MGYNKKEFEYTHIASPATTQCFTGKGILHAIVINSATAVGAVTISDSPSAGSSPVIGVIAAGAVCGVPLVYDVKIAQGLVITTAATPDITVLWTKG